MTDTINQSKRAREETLSAMLEAGLLPGIHHMGMESMEDVEAMYALCDSTEALLVVYRLPREVVEQGRLAGAICAATIAGMPKNAQGRVMLSFDGYASDPRELFEVPEVVDFCRGLLFISPDRPPQENAPRVLSTLVDEDKWAFKEGELVDRRALDMAGSLWLCGAAFPGEVYERNPKSPSGWVRDYGMAFHIRAWLMGDGPPPTQN